MSPSYILFAASGDSSRNGEPGSSRCSTRARGRSLPRSVCRLRERSSPPSAAVAILDLRSETSFSIASALALKAGLVVDTADLIWVIDSHHNKSPRPHACGGEGWVRGWCSAHDV